MVEDEDSEEITSDSKDIVNVIQVIPMTSHKLKSSLHIVIQKRNGWKGEESMIVWKGGGGGGGGGGSNAVLPPRDGGAWDLRLRNVLSRTELSELL